MPGVCTIPDCGGKVASRGWCWKHYERWRKHGDVMWHPPTGAETYAKYTDRSNPDGCHPWRGRTVEGTLVYGILSVAGRATLAHRFGYEMHHGPIPDGLQVRHTCDNPLCQNPKHMLIGTSAQNHADMVERGRSTYGERNPRAKFTEAQVLEIRRNYAANPETHAAIARRHGVHGPAITRILNRKRWTHI